MFGNDDKKDENQSTADPVVSATATTDAPSPFSTTSDATSTPASDLPAPAPSEHPAIQPITPSTPAADNDEPKDEANDESEASPAAADAILAAPVTTSSAPAAPAGVPSDDLLDLKQKALEQLRPLVDHLDPVPEEKFDALMMMIRASDDQSLIQPAYDTAQAITDDKKRAEALLDVVNEINYLTSTQQ